MGFESPPDSGSQHFIMEMTMLNFNDILKRYGWREEDIKEIYYSDGLHPIRYYFDERDFFKHLNRLKTGIGINLFAVCNDEKKNEFIDMHVEIKGYGHRHYKLYNTI